MSVFQTTYAKEELSVKIRIFIYSSLMIICIIFQFSKKRDKKKSMSIRISGVVFLNSSNEELKENVAYSMIESACRFKMGCLLGENISTEIMESYKPELYNQSIAFELMDTPLDSTADQLFGYETNGLNNEDESLNHRLTRIENLFKECFESPVVDKVILDINYLSGYNGSFIEIEVDEFCIHSYSQSLNRAVVRFLFITAYGWILNDFIINIMNLDNLKKSKVYKAKECIDMRFMVK
jgi:hypothetical protein